MGKRLVAGLPVPRERRASDKTGGKDLWAFWGVEKWPSEGGLSPLNPSSVAVHLVDAGSVGTFGTLSRRPRGSPSSARWLPGTVGV